MASCTIVYASTTGHTEYVVERLVAALGQLDPALEVRAVRVERADRETLTSPGVLVLASGTWNTGGVEGQLNPYMHEFVYGRAKDADLTGKHAALIALGDDRYFYTCRAGEHLRQFVQSHGGEVWPHTLTIVNDPYGQEAKVEKWAAKLLDFIRHASTHAHA